MRERNGATLRLLRLDLFLAAAIVLCQAFSVHAFVSVLFYATFIVTFVLWLVVIVKGFDKVDLLALGIMIAALVSVVIDGGVHHASFSFEYFKKYLMFCSTVMFFGAARKIVFDDATYTFFARCYMVLSLALIAAFLLHGPQVHMLNGAHVRYLTFGFTNPNLTGLFLACATMFLCLLSMREKHVPIKALLLMLSAIMLYFLVDTESRNAILSITFFAVFAVVLLLLGKRNLMVPSWVLWLVVLAPLLFVAVYLAAQNIHAFTGIFSAISGEGKGSDSRVIIWYNALSSFGSSPLFGTYYGISNGTGMSQMHNSHVDILCSYGIVVISLTCVYLFLILSHVRKSVQTFDQKIALLAFSCSLLLGIGEAAVFAGGLGIYLFAGASLLMVNYAGNGGKRMGK